MTARETAALKRKVAEAIEKSPMTASLLYDIDLLPEQIKPGDRRREGYMFAVIEHMTEMDRRIAALEKACARARKVSK